MKGPGTVARIKTAEGRKFVVEQRTIMATHGRRAKGRLYEVVPGNRQNIENIDASLGETETVVENAKDALDFHLSSSDGIEQVQEVA